VDIKLNNTTHDLELDSSGNITLTETVPQALGQRLKIKLLLFKNTYFLDMNFGIPYYEQVFVKGATKKLLDAIFKQAIFKTPNVGAIISYKSEFDRPNRKYSPVFSVISKDGQQVTVRG